jgi:RNA polymerase sigma-70 factor (ECF subfamily)
MYRIALNVAISQLRRPRPVHEELATEHEHLVGAADVDAEARQRLALVQRAMQGFGPFDRALLLLHLEGCSQRESAEVLGTTETNVATRLGRIRQQLRRIDATATSPQGDIDGNA